MTPSDLIREARELAEKATPNAVHTHYVFANHAAISDYINATCSKGGLGVHMVEELGSCPPACDQDLVIAFTGNGGNAEANARFLARSRDLILKLAAALESALQDPNA